MPFALKYALRDLGSGLSGFRIFLACIILGIAAISGVNSLTRSLAHSLASESRQILGGDAALGVIHRDLTQEERSWLEAQGKISPIATLRTMAQNGGKDSTLVELKAVGAEYPLIGRIVTEPAKPLAQLLEERGGRSGMIAENALLVRLGLKAGDILRIGQHEFELRGVLKSEPDKLAAGFALGPRVIITHTALDKTGLIQPGSLHRWTYRIALGDLSNASPPPDDAAVRAFIDRAHAQFPDAGWRATSRNNATARMARNVERFSQFLTLVGITALIIGGVGVANAIRGFAERKRRDFAILKSIGASGAHVFQIALTEVLIVAMIGILAGLALGAAIPFAAGWLFSAMLPLPFKAAIFPRELLLAAAFGILITLAFSIPSLGRMHDTPVSSLFRGEAADAKSRIRRRYVFFAAASAAGFVALVIASAFSKNIAAFYIGGTLAIFALLRLFGYGVIRIARALQRKGGPQLRLAIANICRPGALTQSVVLSIGLGLSLLVALVTIDANIREPLQRGVPGETPSFFFLDIQKQQADAFSNHVKKVAPGGELAQAPMMRGRLVQINGKPPGSVKARENVRWVLEGDRGITYASALPSGSTLASGEWWKADYAGPPLVSMERSAAEGLDLKIGDNVTVNIAGRNITAKIANLREVDWQTFGMNFVFVFTPSTLAPAPHTWLATVTFPGGLGGEEENKLAASMSTAFPAVSMVRIKDTLDTVAAIARQLALAIQGATGIGLLASILVLAGAFSAGMSARRYDAVILKVLGATRKSLMTSYLMEFGLLSLVASVFAAAAGIVSAWGILQFALDSEQFLIPWLTIATTTATAVAVTLGLGLAGTWRILGQKPAPALRSL